MKIQSILPLTTAWGFAAIVSAGAWTSLVAQASRPSTSDTVVVIGCVTQQTAAAAERGGQPALQITDTRSKPPRRFILHGDSGQLTWHVGHTLEVHGRLESRESTDAAARDAQLPILNVQAIVYLQPTCVAAPK